MLADQIAAQVSDDIILESRVVEYENLLANDPMAQKMFSNYEELRDYVLNELISQKLILIEAEAESITVSNEEVQGQVKEVIEEIKGRFPSEADFYKALEEQHITIEDLKKYKEENLRTQLIMRKLIEKKLATKIMISPITVKRFYDENKDSIAVLPGRVKLAHILLAVRPVEDELKKKFQEAVDVYKLLLAGGDFGIIAQEFSQDVNSKKNGGMLGRIKKGETLEEFEQVVFNLKPGVVSQPFPTRLGYHIVEVLNKGTDWVLVRQILIKIEITKADSMRYENLANNLHDMINEGANFDSLAKGYTNDPNIDIGEWFIKQLAPPYNDLIKDLNKGEVSKPILTPIGYQLIYIREKVPEKFLSFEDMRDQIYQYLYHQELQDRYNRLIEELREKTFVKTFVKG